MWRSLQLGGGGLPAIDALDRFGRLRTGADDRFDELPVGVFVAAVDQLGHRLPAVGPLVVDAAEIERRERVVGGRTRKMDAKRPVNCSRASRSDGGLEGAELLAGAAAKVAIGRHSTRAPAPASARPRRGSTAPLPRRRPLRSGATGPRDDRSSRCASPRHGPSDENRARCGSVASGTASAPSSASSAWSRATPARSKASIAARAGFGGGTREEASAVRRRRAARTRRRAGRPCRATVTSSSRKPGWPRFSVSSSTYFRASSVRAGARQRRRAANQVPQFGAAARHQPFRRRAARRAAATPGCSASGAAADRARRRHQRAPRRMATAASSANSTSRGTIVGSAAGANSVSTQPVNLVVSVAPAVSRPSSVRSIPTSPTRTAPASSATGSSRIDRGEKHRVAGELQRRAPAIERWRRIGPSRCRPLPRAWRHRRWRQTAPTPRRRRGRRRGRS